MMNAISVVSAIVTIAALLFSVWIYLESRSKEQVEREKIASHMTRLQMIRTSSNAVVQQAILISAMADREETTKKELKHLAVALLASMQAVVEATADDLAAAENSSFGVPTTYRRISSTTPVPTGAREDVVTADTEAAAVPAPAPAEKARA